MEGRERGRQENCSSEPAHSAADEASKSWNEVCVCVCVCVCPVLSSTTWIQAAIMHTF